MLTLRRWWDYVTAAPVNPDLYAGFVLGQQVGMVLGALAMWALFLLVD